MMLGHVPPFSNLRGRQCPAPGEPWQTSRPGDRQQPTDELQRRYPGVALQGHIPEPSTDWGKPAGWGVEGRAVVSACARLDCGGKQGCHAFLLWASRKPPHQCLVTGVTALAKSFKFRQDRTLRHLLACWISAHRAIPLPRRPERTNTAACLRPPPAQ